LPFKPKNFKGEVMKRISFAAWAAALIFCAGTFIDANAQFGRRSPKINEAARVNQNHETESVSAIAAVAPLRVEEFNYPTGQLTATVPSWITNTGTGNFIPISSGSLSYANYPSSGIGNKIDIIATTASAEDTFTDFTPQTSGTVYAAFLVNITNTTLLAANSSTTGDYFAGFISSGSTTAFSNRVTIRAGTTAGTYQMGFRATGNAGNTQIFSNTDLPVGNTMLVVISYQIVAGATNDITNIWINPVITGAEPAPTLTQVSAADSTDVGRFFIRQGNAGTPNASIDGIRIGTTWDSVTKAFISKAPQDMNGDGTSDYVVLRDSNGAAADGFIDWYIMTTTFALNKATWGNYDTNTEDLAAADYDGDGKTDIAVWRKGASNGTFYIIRSQDNSIYVDQLGSPTDQPAPGDYNGDGKAEPGVYRDNGNGTSSWYYRPSPSGDFSALSLPASGSVLQGDYNGDTITDPAVFTNDGAGGGRFVVLLSGGSQTIVATNFGNSTDMVAPGDYDGDGKFDLCVIRPAGGFLTWEYKRSFDGAVVSDTWGVAATDTPTPGDYNGDGKWDYAIWRNTAQGEFFVMTPVTHNIFQRQWGSAGDYPLASHQVGNSGS
jgi:FG-GAP repeat.